MIIPYKKTLLPIKTENKCGLLYWNNLFDTFDTKRIFYLSECTDLNNINKIRGKHVNNDCNEILVVLNGQVKITLNLNNDTYIFDCNKNDYVYIPLGYYLEIEILTVDTIYFVLCDNIR